MKITRIIDETPRVKRFVFDESLDFVPGQWVSVWSDEFLQEGKPVRRAFSIASEPGAPLELCVARGEFFSKFLHEANVGDVFNVKGPFGVFHLREHRKAFFIAGGTGIAPFVPMTNQAIRGGYYVVLLYSARSKEEILYRDWLERIRDRIMLTITLTREPHNGFEQGRVTKLLKDTVKDDYDYYVCGFNQFIEDVAKELLAQGILKERMFFDKWG